MQIFSFLPTPPGLCRDTRSCCDPHTEVGIRRLKEVYARTHPQVQ